MHVSINFIQSIAFALALVISNVGAHFIIVDIRKRYGGICSHPNLRYFYIFSMAYAGTQDILLSFISAVFYKVIIN